MDNKLVFAEVLAPAKVGDAVEFFHAGAPRRETILERTETIVVSVGQDGQLTAWSVSGGYVENSGFVFSSGTTASQAVEKVLRAQRGWAGLAVGAAEADKYI